MTSVKRTAERAVALVDEHELAVRLCEAHNNMVRPFGCNAAIAISFMTGEERHRWLKAARAALAYWRECAELAQKT